MNPSGIVFGLGAALSWGGGDFAAGYATRRVAPVVTMALSQAVGLAIALALLAIAREPGPNTPTIAWAMVGGTSGVVCLLALYRGLATNPMGLFSAIATVIAICGFAGSSKLLVAYQRVSAAAEYCISRLCRSPAIGARSSHEPLPVKV
jgi:drug/metabolite transporter (DMT)-like permease